jgi:hypothetical protein
MFHQQETPNARINPTADDTTQASRSHTSIIKAMLRRVGLNELLGGALKESTQLDTFVIHTLSHLL